MPVHQKEIMLLTQVAENGALIIIEGLWNNNTATAKSHYLTYELQPIKMVSFEKKLKWEWHTYKSRQEMAFEAVPICYNGPVVITWIRQWPLPKELVEFVNHAKYFILYVSIDQLWWKNVWSWINLDTSNCWSRIQKILRHNSKTSRKRSPFSITKEA